MSRLSNWLLGISESVARRRNRELRVEVGPGGPKAEWVKPEATEDYGWDNSLYHKGQVHLQGFYNPIHMTKHEVETDDEDAEEWEHVLIPSQNYKSALLTTEIIPKAFDPLNLDELKKYLMACLGASGFAVVILLYVASNLP